MQRRAERKKVSYWGGGSTSSRTMAQVSKAIHCLYTHILAVLWGVRVPGKNPPQTQDLLATRQEIMCYFVFK